MLWSASEGAASRDLPMIQQVPLKASLEGRGKQRKWDRGSGQLTLSLGAKRTHPCGFVSFSAGVTGNNPDCSSHFWFANVYFGPTSVANHSFLTLWILRKNTATVDGRNPAPPFRNPGF